MCLQKHFVTWNTKENIQKRTLYVSIIVKYSAEFDNLSHLDTMDKIKSAAWYWQYMYITQSSCPVIHKFRYAGIFILVIFENKLDVVISHINFILKHHDKCKFALKLINSQFISIRSYTKNANIANFVYYGKTRLQL